MKITKELALKISRMSEQQLEARMHELERDTDPSPALNAEYEAIEAELSDRMDSYFTAA